MKHTSRTQTDASTLGVEGRITACGWSVDDLRRRFKAWDVLDDGEKLARLRKLDPETDAEWVNETSNIALDGLLNFIAKALDPSSSASDELSHLAVGTGTADPDPANTSLGNEVYRTRVGDADVDGGDLLTSTLLSQIEANGNTLTEIGLAGGPSEDFDDIRTHALFESGQEIDKNTNMAVTIDYVIEFRRGGA